MRTSDVSRHRSRRVGAWVSRGAVDGRSRCEPRLDHRLEVRLCAGAVELVERSRGEFGNPDDHQGPLSGLT